MDLEADSSPCSPAFYQLQKCVKYFPQAGLVSFENATRFCDINGGKLAEVPKNVKNVEADSAYISGI